MDVVTALLGEVIRDDIYLEILEGISDVRKQANVCKLVTAFLGCKTRIANGILNKICSWKGFVSDVVPEILALT